MNTLLVTETVAWAAMGVSMLMTLLTVSGLAYLMLALVGARDFLASSRKANAKSKARDAFTPAISLLKPVKGIDPEMMTAFRSHCLQDYPGEYELIFGVSELSDPATDAVRLLQAEFPSRRIELVVCPERLGTNGKVSNLVQMLGAARHEFCVINDGDIVVSPQYLKRVMAEFADEKVGLVTVPYRGRAGRGLWSRLEALGISTDFMAGVMTARWLEGWWNISPMITNSACGFRAPGIALRWAAK
jgi:ceramide glucosyltransferase